ncbi:DNA polymerase Y family protein [Nocardia alni]|uniref:DNA polymerase Y family protein n=1 Tax=Nocardia alni TaxID=2815723 RepID=UPI001C22B235|nr:DNA polymerase Y family protein [Nocardia alni]
MLALWCPDWPAVAAGAAAGVSPVRPVAVLHANRVVACSETARAAGVRRGARRREAQSRCPDLYVAQADPDRDARLFEPVVAAVDEVAPGAEVLRAGLLVLVARGATRFFGSEEASAERLVDAVAAVGVECRIGIADEMSTAVLAARRAALVPPGRGAEFLAPLPVGELAVEPSLAGPGREDLVDLLHRLGLRRIGDFAALTPAEVASRFDADAIAAHRCARAEPERPPAPHPPAAELAVQYPCDPPIERVDAAAFAGRLLATRLHERLAAASLACTRLEVIAETESGERLSRIWRCAEPLTPDGTADRIRWQLDGWLTRRALRGPGRDEWSGIAAIGRADAVIRTDQEGSGVDPARASRPGVVAADEAGVSIRRSRERRAPELGIPVDRKRFRPNEHEPAPIVLLRLEPIEVVSAGTLQLGLWGGAGQEQEAARRALVRVQGLLGGEAVQVGVLSGGRGPVERVTLIALGDEQTPAADPTLPWPGRLPEPAPAVVLVNRPEVVLESADDAPVWVTDRGLFTAEPTRLRWGGKHWEVTGWAGPWLLDERWWAGPRPAVRAQVLLAADVKVLLLFGYTNTWHVEGLYE